MAKQKTKAKEPDYNVINKEIAVRLEKINKEKTNKV